MLCDGRYRQQGRRKGVVESGTVCPSLLHSFDWCWFTVADKSRSPLLPIHAVYHGVCIYGNTFNQLQGSELQSGGTPFQC